MLVALTVVNGVLAWRRFSRPGPDDIFAVLLDTGDHWRVTFGDGVEDSLAGSVAFAGARRERDAEEAGGFGDVMAWSQAMEKQDLILEKDGKLWLRYGFWGADEVEEVTGRTYPHNVRFDITAVHPGQQRVDLIL